MYNNQELLNNFILPVLGDDLETLKQGLERLINRGFKPIDLQHVFEWARALYVITEALQPQSTKLAKDTVFFLATLLSGLAYFCFNLGKSNSEKSWIFTLNKAAENKLALMQTD